jgi:hypothetical protein
MKFLQEVQAAVGGRIVTNTRGLHCLTVCNGEKIFNVYEKSGKVQVLMPNGERKPFKTPKQCSDWMKVIGAKE